MSAAAQQEDLVGRRPQIRALRRLVEECRQGHAVLAPLEGPDGAGMSSLVEAVFGGAEDLDVHLVPGLSWESDSGGGLARRLLLDIGQQLPVTASGHETAETAETSEGSARPGTSTRRRDPARCGHVLAEALRRHHDEVGQPVVLVVDHARHADPTSLRALSSAVHRLPDVPVLIVVLAAHTEIPLDAVEGEGLLSLAEIVAVHASSAITLPGLTAEEVAEVAERQGRTLGRDAAQRLARHTQGVVRDIVDLLREHPSAPLTPEIELPATRAATVAFAAAYARLPASARVLVEAAAVLPPGSPATDLAQVADLDDVLPALEAARAAGVLRMRGEVAPRVEFAAPMTRAAAHAGLDLVRRRELHLRASQVVVDEGEQLRQLAHACWHHDDDLAARLGAYADRVGAEGRWGLASDALVTAASLASPGPGRNDLLVRALDAITGAGDVARAEALVPEVESLGPSASAHATLAFVAMHMGRRSEALRLLDSAWLQTNPRVHPETAAVVCQRRVLHSLFDWDADQLVTWADRQFELTDGESIHALESRVIVGIGYALQGRLADARRAQEYAATIQQGAQAQRALLGQGWLDLAHDDLHEAASRLQTATPMDFQRGSTRVSGWSLGWLARTRFALGEWDAALESAAQAIDLTYASGITALSPLAHWSAAEIRALRGEWDLAATHVVRAGEAPQQYPVAVLSAALARASVARARGEHDAVLRACAPVLALRRTRPVDAPGFWPWQDLYAEALVLTGRLDQADAFLRPLEESARRHSHRSMTARLLTARGRWHAARGDLTRSIEAFEEALGLLGGLPMPYARATTLFAYGLSLRHAGRRRDGATRLVEAHELFTQLGAPGFAAQCSRELNAAGMGASGEAGRSGRGRGQRVAPTAGHALEEVVLTPQESEIVRLVAQGRRNREVAADLYVSVKTVEYHLTRIYAKAGVGSRGELAAWYRTH